MPARPRNRNYTVEWPIVRPSLMESPRSSPLQAVSSRVVCIVCHRAGRLRVRCPPSREGCSRPAEIRRQHSRCSRHRVDRGRGERWSKSPRGHASDGESEIATYAQTRVGIPNSTNIRPPLKMNTLNVYSCSAVRRRSLAGAVARRLAHSHSGHAAWGPSYGITEAW
jgi:hypothetical protein